MELKSEEQQAILGVHRLRELRVKMRSMLVNQLHGVMGEFGIALPKGWGLILKQARQVLADFEHCQVPALLRGALFNQIQQIRTLSEQIKDLERQIAAWQRRAEEWQRIAQIPGVWITHCYRSGGHNGRCTRIPLGARVCRAPRTRTPSLGHRWTGKAFGD